VRSQDEETVGAYLPANYQVTHLDAEFVYIAGEDRAGWTLDAYVIPRLASGLHLCEEVALPPFDVRVQNLGSLIGFDLQNDNVRDWWEEHVHDTPSMGPLLFVEPRYAGDIIEGLRDEGFVVGEVV
jgi:hypothetical protein